MSHKDKHIWRAKPHIWISFFASGVLSAGYVCSSVMLIVLCDSFVGAIRKNNGKEVGFGAKMLKNRPERG